MKNLAYLPEYQTIKKTLQKRMQAQLILQQDPRILGKGSVFEGYQYSDARTRNFYQRYMQGEKVKAGWVNPTDFESRSLD